MFLVSRPSKRFSTSSLQTEEDTAGHQHCCLLVHACLLPGHGKISPERHSLIHVESQGDVLILGEE